jgi:hypothetical protein
MGRSLKNMFLKWREMIGVGGMSGHGDSVLDVI